MSSKFYKDSISLSGVFDQDLDKSVLYSANKVYLRYCTSDGHMGNKKANDDIPFFFRGAKVVQAMISSLTEDQGLTAGDQLIFGGHSAGGRGAMVHLDQVAESLPDVSVVGLLDSPLYMDLMPLYESLSGLNTHMALAHQNFDVESIISDECKAAYSQENEWRCIFGQYRMKFIKTPFLLLAD